jgi:hypothetical protein
VKQGVFKNAYWSLMLLLAFAAIQLLPAMYQPIHLFIYQREQSNLAQINAESTSLESLRMSEASYAAIDEGEHEISWNGKRYDIKSVRFANGFVELLVKQDTFETKLKSLVQLIQGSSEGHSGPQSVQQFYAFYFEELNTMHLIIPTRLSSQLLVAAINLENSTLAVIAPPPRA